MWISSVRHRAARAGGIPVNMFTGDLRGGHVASAGFRNGTK